MSSKSRVKFMIFVAVVITGIPVLLVIFFLFSQFIAYFQQGADPASIFKGHALLIPKPADAEWITLRVRDDEVPSIAEQEEIISAYWQAWDALERAHLTGDVQDLTTYWAGDAYKEAFSSIEGKKNRFKTSNHNLLLTFFSTDGSVVAFDDNQFTMQQVVNGMTIDVTASATVVMTLDQGFWRVRAIEIHF